MHASTVDDELNARAEYSRRRGFIAGGGGGGVAWVGVGVTGVSGVVGAVKMVVDR